VTWRECPLGEVVRFQRGHDLPDQDRKPGDVPVIGSAGQNGWHNEAIAKGPGVSIGRSGASIGKVTYTSIDYWPHNACLYVTDFLGNNPRFVFYLLKTKDFSSLNSGAAQPSLNRNFVHTLPIKVPGPSEQAAIAEALSEYDDLIENNRRRIAMLEDAARMLYREWFIHFRFPGHEHATMANGIPAGWVLRSLGDVVNTVKETIQPRDFSEDDIHIGLEHIPRRSFTLADWEAAESPSRISSATSAAPQEQHDGCGVEEGFG
jgi:type I restriction enzyme, S subunit